MEKIKALATSRRFWALALAVYNLLNGDATPILQSLQGTQDILLTGALGSWIVGDSLRKTE